MCDIGKPIEIIDVEPLSLPAPLRREKESPAEQPVTVEVPGLGDDRRACHCHRREALTWRGRAPIAAAVCPTPGTAWIWRRCPTRTSSRSRRTVRGTGQPRASRPSTGRCGRPSKRSKPRATTPTTCARCKPPPTRPAAKKFWEKQAHHVPDPDCTCGMYAGINMQHLIDIGYIQRGIHGEVSPCGAASIATRSGGERSSRTRNSSSSRRT